MHVPRIHFLGVAASRSLAVLISAIFWLIVVLVALIMFGAY
jgi:hypothetical protein